MLTEITTLDAILEDHRPAIGNDFAGYRNHTYRVANLCLALSADGLDRQEKIAIATAFHDLGIWTDRTFDYLQPSVRLARAYLSGLDRTEWSDEIATMILEHHKVLPWRQGGTSLVEAFRRADWIDVSMGALGFGLPRSLVRDLYATWPGAGFHKRLVQLTLERWRSHPLSPLPMVKL